MTYILEVKDKANLEIIEAYLYYEEKRTGLGEEFLEHLDSYFERITAFSTKAKTLPRSLHKGFSIFGHLRNRKRESRSLFCV